MNSSGAPAVQTPTTTTALETKTGLRRNATKHRWDVPKPMTFAPHEYLQKKRKVPNAA